MLAPGGKREAVPRTEFCLFSCEPMMEAVRAHVQVSASVALIVIKIRHFPDSCKTAEKV